VARPSRRIGPGSVSEWISQFEDLSDLWLGLRVTKLFLLFDLEGTTKVKELPNITEENVFQILKDLVIDSAIRPRLVSPNHRTVFESTVLFCTAWDKYSTVQSN
jgi:hypothetical protein